MHRWSRTDPGMKDLVGSRKPFELTEEDSNLGSARAGRELCTGMSSGSRREGAEGDALLQEAKPKFGADMSRDWVAHSTALNRLRRLLGGCSS